MFAQKCRCFLYVGKQGRKTKRYDRRLPQKGLQNTVESQGCVPRRLPGRSIVATITRKKASQTRLCDVPYLLALEPFRRNADPRIRFRDAIGEHRHFSPPFPASAMQIPERVSCGVKRSQRKSE